MADYVAEYGKYLTGEKHASSNTVSSYLRDISQFEVYLRENLHSDLRRARQEMVQSYMDWMHGRGKSAASVTRFVASIKSFYNYMMATDAVKVNPAKGVVADHVERKYPEILTNKEVELFLEQPR